MKPLAIVALVWAGLVIRMYGWQFMSRSRTSEGFALVIAGTLVTLSIVLVLGAAGAK
jgi:hypothetical protein